MGLNSDLDWRTVVAAEVAAPARTAAFAPTGLTSRKRLVREQIAETRRAYDVNAPADGLRSEILHDERPIVVSEEADVIDGIKADEHVAAQQSADLIDDALRQAVEIGEIIGDGQGIERALAVLGRNGHRIAGGGGAKGDRRPGVVLEVMHLRQHDVQVRFGAGARRVAAPSAAKAVAAKTPGDDAVARDLDFGDVLKAFLAQCLDQ